MSAHQNYLGQSRSLRGFFAGILWLGVSFEALVCHGESFSPQERFQRLLSHPPVAVEMLYQEKLPSNVNRPTPLDVGLSGSSNFLTFKVVWQTNAMFFQSAPPPEGTLGNLPPPRVPAECFALWNGTFYFLDAGQYAFVYQMASEQPKPRAFPPPFHVATFKQARACEPLNLGIGHLKPGAVIWSGDEFSAVGSADQKPMFIRGKITGWTNDIPNQVRLQYSNDMGIAQYRLEYLYEKYEPPYYPTAITSYFQHKGREIEYRAYRILAVSVTNHPLSKDAFDPEKYMAAHGMVQRWMTNGTIYGQLPSGALVETPGAMPKLKLSAQDYYANRYYYLVVLLTTLGFLALAAKGNRSTPKVLTNPINHYE